MRRTLALLALLSTGLVSAQTFPTGNVVFFHPDGTGANTWSAARMYWVGPDASLNWDRLPEIALYRGHMADVLVGTSNGGATTHAFGVKVSGPGSYGRDGDGAANPPTDRPIKSLSGYPGSLMREAASKGHPVGVVNDGHVGEPGTGCFLAEVGNRGNWDEISLQMLTGRPGAGDPLPQVVIGGGEENFLPVGAAGVHGPGKRADGRDLVAEARVLGYTVVRTRAKFEALKRRLQDEASYLPRVLGLFASKHTFNDRTEEALIEAGFVRPAPAGKAGRLVLWGQPDPASPGYEPPTMAEMTALALTVLERAAEKAEKPFFLVAEPESCDNLGNSGNAIGTLMAVKRADDALGQILAFIARRPDTLVLTAADSDANGLQVDAVRRAADGSASMAGTTPGNPGKSQVAVPLDGIEGPGTPVFEAEPDAFGNRWLFAIAWAADSDVGGGILSRAAGRNAELLRQLSGRFDNTDVYRVMHTTLFGTMPPSGVGVKGASR